MLGKVWESVLVCVVGRGREMGGWVNVGKGARRCFGVWRRQGENVGCRKVYWGVGEV